jgi:hypothetical protein
LINVNIAIAIAVTVCALKVILLCNTLHRILWRLNHLGFDALFAGCSTTTEHDYRLALTKVESLLAFKAFHYVGLHLFI